METGAQIMPIMTGNIPKSLSGGNKMKKGKMTLKKWEGGKKDEAIDKKAGYKEGSKADMKVDKKMVAKANKGKKK
jgi:hypothetical protein